jgi:hypothetical protein
VPGLSAAITLSPEASGVDGGPPGLARSAVDMPLRLDNAGALPTYPQPPQQQEEVYA